MPKTCSIVSIHWAKRAATPSNLAKITKQGLALFCKTHETVWQIYQALAYLQLTESKVVSPAREGGKKRRGNCIPGTWFKEKELDIKSTPKAVHMMAGHRNSTVTCTTYVSKLWFACCMWCEMLQCIKQDPRSKLECQELKGSQADSQQFDQSLKSCFSLHSVPFQSLLPYKQGTEAFSSWSESQETG